MITWALIFFLLAIIASGFGLAGVAGVASSIAKILFLIFAIAFLATLFSGRGKPRTHR